MYDASAARAAPSHAGPPLWQLLQTTAQAAAAVMAGSSLTAHLASLEPRYRPGTQALTFHVMRWWGAAQALREQLAPRRPAPEVDALLCSALALLWPPSEPPYAAHVLVDQAVRAAQGRHARSAGFINAVLRSSLRLLESNPDTMALLRTPPAQWNHPAWWVKRLQGDWPHQAADILRAAQHRPPMTLRVRAPERGGDYLARWATAGLRGFPLAGLPQAVVLESACPVERLPGFDRGEVSVQDAAAQLAAPLVLGPDAQALPRGARVLDACAAPGGKTAHILELRPDVELLALDVDPRRLAQVSQGLQRLGLNGATCVAADAAQTQTWWDGRPFDAILLDAPCSGSGVVRRHPDIRWLRRPGDIASLSATQARLLDALWPLLRPGGRMVYATCSVFRAEGQDQIDAFLQRLGPAAAMLDPLSPGHLLPVPDNGASGLPGATPPGVTAPVSDGFFYALIHKP